MPFVHFVASTVGGTWGGPVEVGGASDVQRSSLGLRGEVVRPVVEGSAQGEGFYHCENAVKTL